jgi:AraC family transcriptional regulator
VESIRNWSLRDPLIWNLTNEISQTCIPHQDDNRAQVLALANCLAARLVRRLGRQELVAQPTVRRLNPEAMRRVDAFIEERLAEKISVVAVAKQARLSASHFGTLFRATTGTSCLQYILQFRLARAKALLASGAY